MTIERQRPGGPLKISGNHTRDPSQPGEMPADVFKRRLSRIAFDVGEQPRRSSVKRFYVFDAMNTPASAIAKAQLRDDAGLESGVWGHSSVFLQWSLAGCGGTCRVKAYKIRLDPPTDSDLDKIAATVASALPPSPEVNVWQGKIPENGRVPHVGTNSADCHPTDFLDFLSDLLPAYKETHTANDGSI